MLFTKYEGNPILEPLPGSDWEKHAVCNPGAAVKDGRVYMLYRASGETDTYHIYMGLAVSNDGFKFTRASDRPIYNPTREFEKGCVEDPRIVELEGAYYVTYACRAVPYTAFVEGKIKPNYPPGSPRALTENLTRTGLLKTTDFRSYECLGPITRDDVDDRDVLIFPSRIGGKYVMLHRPAEWVGAKYGSEKPGIWMAFSDDLIHWSGETLLAQPRPGVGWEEKKIGGSTPPIRTDRGWLLMYHGVQGEGKARRYRQGYMMLDLEDPRKIIARPEEFVLEPELPWELEGVEPGVVFAVGNIVLGDRLFVYYGGADKVIGVATARLKDVVDWVMKNA